MIRMQCVITILDPTTALVKMDMQETDGTAQVMNQYVLFKISTSLCGNFKPRQHIPVVIFVSFRFRELSFS